MFNVNQKSCYPNFAGKKWRRNFRLKEIWSDEVSWYRTKKFSLKFQINLIIIVATVDRHL